MRNCIKPVKQGKTVKCFIKGGLFTALLFVVFLGFGCGKRKPPLPPNQRVAQRAELDGYQRGNQIVLEWRMPARNAKGGSVLSIERIDIYRLAEPLNSPDNLTEEEFAARSTLIDTVSVTDEDYRLKLFNYNDQLQFAGQAVRLRYALRFVNNAGQKAAFSNFFLVEPTASVAQPPTAISSEVQAESILLKWASPAANIDNSKPVNILGYNIYRAASVSEQYKVLNSAPITRNDFEDVEFDFGAKYKYFVRTVSLGSAGQPIESQDSQTIEVTPKDVFPPSAPGSITIAASQRAISIFFINNPERDIAGYRVYRSLDRGLPLNQWLNLTPELLQTNVFQDEKVERETRYFYYLIAVDKAGNVSEPSEIVTEALP